ncbi:C4-dicarboxylate ABC transporter permease (plasmid) [Azospirillum argentinense]|uniref:TRAP transporter small permease protein n=1 Tax=Azospirillum argentinense TaxID=2970906 RepID=A0A2K1G3K9_9PROT|nr:TRAP transporter small permease [Azospirillum argentinense]AIB14646.1 C4-dicarboxylate ABC transporter permease [Azospirillum argentinense]EZQ05178.1 C4-dicarboxylate ABC transporter permease [Azospirillum argentinense]KAA1055939.1 TRAP dicarboxylate transporter, DctQ subunit, unknown substrate 8 [Azospirillum argentinense]MBK3800944.1 TRAP transporter small permease subunit [Azospirillum argentinense]PNQ99269.1 TRAP transporter small permease [Azospirillum argentinense]
MELIRRLPSVVAGTALAGLVVMTIVAVIARYVFDAPLHWGEEMSGLLMIWIIMIGAIVAERDGQHLEIPLFVDLLPTRIRAAVDLAISALSILVLGYAGWLGYLLAQSAQYKLTEILQISWFWIDIAVPVGAAGLVAYLLHRCFIDIMVIVKGEAP